MDRLEKQVFLSPKNKGLVFGKHRLSGKESFRNLCLLAPTGAGKTTFCRYFKKLYPQRNMGDQEEIPVVHVKLKSGIAGLTGFYTALLEPYGSPLSHPGVANYQRMKIAQLHEMLKAFIRQAKTLIIFVDEFQHIYQKRKKGHYLNQAIINHLKLLMEEARVAIIPVGVMGVEDFLSLDSQLVGRCPIKDYSRLEYWGYPNLNDGINQDLELKNIKMEYPKLSSKKVKILLETRIREKQQKNIEIRGRFRKLLLGFEQFLPFPEPSNLSSPQMADLIFEKVQFTNIDEGPAGKTNFRKIAWFLRNAGNLALKRHHLQITEQDIRETWL